MGRLEPGLPPGVESALGRFVADFALLEEYLRGVICEIPKTSAPAGEIITSELSFRGIGFVLRGVGECLYWRCGDS